MKPAWLVRLVLALGSGAALALAYPKFNFPLLAWVSPAILLVAVIGARMPSAALFAFLHGAVLATVSLPWIYTVMRVHGNIAPLPAGGVMAAMVAAWSLYFALFGAILAWAARRSVAAACWLAPPLWVTLEFARTHMPIIGFPWNLLGYPASENPALLQITAWTGIYGLSLLVAGYNGLLVWAWLAPVGKRVRAWKLVGGVTLALIVVAVLGPRGVPRAEAHHRARLVQLNLPEMPTFPPNWMSVHAGELDELERLSTAPATPPAELIVWPEVPAPFTFGDASFAGRAQRIAQEARADFLLGVVDWKAAAPGGPLLPFNSAALLDRGGRRVFVYDKIHLVAFGEYVPLRRWLTFAQSLTADIGDFTPGHEYRVGQVESGQKFGAFICYEAVFPDLVRHFAANGAQLFVNISNDGWFGGTAAPAQHLMMARVRAVENRRWLLRGTNTGYTASVDPYGRIAAQLAPDVRAALDAPYDFRADATLYTRWGDWIAWLSLAAAVVLLGAVLGRGANHGKEGTR
jgi:apolipoprotein N-acyltransferase